MKYAIIIWMCESEAVLGTGTVYGWYESLATALNTCIDLRRDPRYWRVVAVKIM